MRARRSSAPGGPLRPSHRLALGLVLVAALGVGLCCVRREPEQAPVAAPAARATGDEDSAPTLPRDEGDSAAPRAHTHQERAGEAAPRDTAPNPVSTFMRHSDEHDRALLASVERETKKSPSPEVLELLAMRRRGASPSELERYIDAELAGDLRVRAAARRWLRESTGAEAPARSPLPGQGGGERKVQSIAPR